MTRTTTKTAIRTTIMIKTKTTIRAKIIIKIATRITVTKETTKITITTRSTNAMITIIITAITKTATKKGEYEKFKKLLFAVYGNDLKVYLWKVYKYMYICTTSLSIGLMRVVSSGRKREKEKRIKTKR